MRVIVDKVESRPAHAVTSAEVREALGRLPSEWTSPIKAVRISASMHSWEIAAFSRISSRLVLCTRGRDKAEVFAAMHRELFAKATQTHPIPAWRLSAKQKTALDVKAEALLARAPKA